MSDQVRDVIVIGDGMAGLTGALWLGRFRRDTLVIGSGQPRNSTSTVFHGYPGQDGGDPRELHEQLKREVDRYGVERLSDTVVNVDKEDDVFRVVTEATTHLARRLLLATGTKDRRPDLPDFDQFDGVSAWHCPACDGYEHSEKPVVVVAWGPQMAGYTMELLAYTNDITLLSHGHAFDGSEEEQKKLADNGIRVIDTRIAALNGEDGRLRSVTLEDGSEVACEGLFYSINHAPQLGFFESLGCELADGCVVVNKEQATSIEGVYAAGDVAPLLDLVVVAAATGAVAASSIHQSLVPESQRA